MAKNVWNFLGKLAVIVNIFLFFGLCYLYLSGHISHPSGGWNWADFVTILLGVVAIVVAALGTLIAVAALWGYQQIQKSAEIRSEEAVNNYLKSEGFDTKLGKMIEEQIEKAPVIKAVEGGIALKPKSENTKKGSQGTEKEWDDQK